MKDGELLIYHHNIRSVESKTIDLKIQLNELQPDIISLNETHLKENNTFEIKGYNIISFERKAKRIGAKQGGGVLIAVKKEIPYKVLNIQNSDEHNEAVGVLLRDQQNEEIIIVSLYCPKGKPSTKLIEELAIHKNIVITGDLNVRHKYINSDKNTKGGVDLYNICTKTKLQFANDFSQITHVNDITGATSSIDLTITSMISKLKNFETGEDLGSDHFSTLTTFKVNIISNITNQNPKTKVTLYHKANWEKHNNTLLEKMKWLIDNNKVIINPVNYIETSVEKLNIELHNIINEIPSKKISTNNIGIPPDIRELIKEKRKIRKEWQNRRDPTTKTKLNNINLKIKAKIKLIKEKN